jgi:iron complex outermembrane recepter protein
MNSKVSYAVAAILSSASLAAHAEDQTTPSPAAVAPADTESDALQEVTVTAQRRSENMQNVPISMQALTAQSLQQLNISTLDDYIKFLPNVTTASNGPGQSEIYMRGLSAGTQPSQGSGSTGLWPNVALYLDNQSGQLPNRNLDVYAVDLERIEVLEGPQGTLFGSGAEAGAVRYITNQPKLGATEAEVTGGTGSTAHGGINGKVTGMVNIPLVTDKFAVRAVIYYDRRGGYIDNVPATFTRKDTDFGIHYAYYATGGVPPGSCALNNFGGASGCPVPATAGRDINPVTYQGIRGEALYKINDDWDLLITQSYQKMDADGVFYQQPNASDGAALAPLQVTTFNPSFDDDKFESTAWTINGKFGALKAVYTGGYLIRNVDQVGDYTNYARGIYADYYQCYAANAQGTCASPSATWHTKDKNEHMQHEFRVSTPDDWRLRAIGGLYWEDDKLYDQTAWNYKTEQNCSDTVTAYCFTPISIAPGTSVQSPSLIEPSTSFYQDTLRDTKQTAVFASVDYDLIPKALTITAGTRWYQFKNSYVGNVSSSFFCHDAGPSCLDTFVPSTAYYSDATTFANALINNYNLNSENLRDTESGFKSRANLTWHITSDAMLYYTYSQGFRPGGFNQVAGVGHLPGADGLPQYVVPRSYSSDKLTNNEVGWKTEFFDHRLQWNGAVYQENWDNVQTAFFSPAADLGNVFFNINGQNFRIRGVETSLVARPMRGLTLQYSASWNQSEQTNAPQLIDNNPYSDNYGKPIPGAINPYGTQGSPSADAPPLQFAVRARYEWNIGNFSPFLQAGVTHQGHSYTQAGANPNLDTTGLISTGRLRFENPAYSQVEASAGVSKDAWTATIYGENLADSNASTFVSTDQFIVQQTPLRPRIVGVDITYKFQ